MTWEKYLTVWLVLMVAGYGWSMGTFAARVTRRIVARRRRRS